MCSAHCSTLKMTCFLPPSLTPATLPPHTHTNSACLAHSLSSSLLYFPTSFTHSIPPSPWLSYITLCLTDSPVSLPLPHSLHSLSHSLPYIALPHPIPSHSPASLIHFFFTQSLPHYPLTHSCPTLSLNHSLPSSLTASYSTFIHSLTHRLPYILTCSLTYFTSFTPLPHSLSHSLFHSIPCITLSCTQSLLTSLPPSFTFSSLSHCPTLPSLTHSCSLPSPSLPVSLTPCLTLPASFTLMSHPSPLAPLG